MKHSKHTRPMPKSHKMMTEAEHREYMGKKSVPRKDGKKGK